MHSDRLIRQEIRCHETKVALQVVSISDTLNNFYQSLRHMRVQANEADLLACRSLIHTLSSAQCHLYASRCSLSMQPISCRDRPETGVVPTAVGLSPLRDFDCLTPQHQNIHRRSPVFRANVVALRCGQSLRGAERRRKPRDLLSSSSFAGPSDMDISSSKFGRRATFATFATFAAVQAIRSVSQHLGSCLCRSSRLVSINRQE
jgi:hypothetical protein